MRRHIAPRFWPILGVGAVVVLGLGLLLAFLGRGPGAPSPIFTPAPTTPSDDPVVASITFNENTRSITHSFWQEAVLLDQAMSGLAGQPAPAAEETLQRLVNEELVLQAHPAVRPPTAEQVEQRIVTLEQGWGVGDAAVAAALEQVGLGRDALVRAIERLLAVEAGLEALQSQGYDVTAWLEQRRASVHIQTLGNAAALAIPAIQVPPLTSFTSPPPAPAVETLGMSPRPTPPAEAIGTSPLPVPPTETPYPTPALALPEVAPDFTLQRARGGTLTLAEQLAQGPVVLVFIQRGG